MERILIFIKHHLRFVWTIIEWGNGLVFSTIYKPKLGKVIPEVLNEFSVPPYSYRRIGLQDSGLIFELIKSQNLPDLKYFNPHGFDMASIKEQSKKNSFLMMGTFDGDKMAGYFFLRFFANRECFVGRLVDKNYRGKGIGKVMNSIMYQIAWRMDFRCLSTISRNNSLVMRAHSKNSNMIVLKELQDDYLLVEFVRKVKDSYVRTNDGILL